MELLPGTSYDVRRKHGDFGSVKFFKQGLIDLNYRGCRGDNDAITYIYRDTETAISDTSTRYDWIVVDHDSDAFFAMTTGTLLIRPLIFRWTSETGMQPFHIPRFLYGTAVWNRFTKRLHYSSGDEYMYTIDQNGEIVDEIPWDTYGPIMFDDQGVMYSSGHTNDKKIFRHTGSEKTVAFDMTDKLDRGCYIEEMGYHNGCIYVGDPRKIWCIRGMGTPSVSCDLLFSSKHRIFLYDVHPIDGTVLYRTNKNRKTLHVMKTATPERRPPSLMATVLDFVRKDQHLTDLVMEHLPEDICLKLQDPCIPRSKRLRKMRLLGV